MSNSLATTLLQTGALIFLVAAFSIVIRKTPRLLPAVAAVLSFFIYIAAERQFFGMAPRPELFAGAWNWYGKLLGVGVVSMAILVLPNVGLRGTGITFRQNTKSLLPAIIVTLLWAGVIWGGEYLTKDGGSTDMESLAFQATMPGISEELMFRGLLLLLLNQAFDFNWSLFGAKLGAGAILTSVLFGLVHGFGMQDGQIYFFLVPVLVTGVAGFVFAYLKERTGSLLFPIFSHNLTNFGAQFF